MNAGMMTVVPAWKIAEAMEDVAMNQDGTGGHST
jgi:hypothetical protein